MYCTLHPYLRAHLQGRRVEMDVDMMRVFRIIDVKNILIGEGRRRQNKPVMKTSLKVVLGNPEIEHEYIAVSGIL